MSNENALTYRIVRFPGIYLVQVSAPMSWNTIAQCKSFVEAKYVIDWMSEDAGSAELDCWFYDKSGNLVDGSQPEPEE